MSSEWPQVSLREFADLLAGFAFKSSGYTEDSADVRLLRGDNIAPGKVRWDGVKRWPSDKVVELSRYALEPGDVVLAMDRPWIPAGLKVAQVNETDTPSYLVQRVARLRTISLEDRSFLFALLSTPDFESYIQNATTGTAVPHISAKQILDYAFKLPPVHVRAEVGALAAALYDRIALLSETNATLEAIAQALFKSWFVDFDPVRAKQQGLAPEGMDEATAALFPDGFEESELGVVPRGWATGPILDISTLHSGGTPKTDRAEYWGGEILWASARDVSQSNGSVLIDTERTITQRGLEESSTRMIPALATVMVARGATTGRIVISGRSMAMNQTCYALTSKVDTPIALYCLLKQQINSLVNAAHGSVFDTITTTTFAQSRVVKPDLRLLHAFEEIANPLFEKVIAGAKAAQSLEGVRNTLLPRLISGQLRLPDAKAQLEEAAA